MKEIAYLEIAEKLEKSGKTHVANIQDLLKPYLFQNYLQYLNVTITSISDAWGVGCHKVQKGRKLDKFLGQITLIQVKLCFSSWSWQNLYRIIDILQINQCHKTIRFHHICCCPNHAQFKIVICDKCVQRFQI